jgi:DNA repair protein RadD
MWLQNLNNNGILTYVSTTILRAEMKPQLRPFQASLKAAILAAWLTVPNVLAVSATGSGKTVLFSDIISDERGASVVIAHRHELVSQISLALARNGIRHRIVGSDDLRRECSTAHMEELRCDYVDVNSRVAAASVDTLVRMDASDPWFASVRLWVMDEAHHLLQNNKWGKAVAMFPNARGLGVTATPERADGYGLGAMNDGVFHEMVVAPGMRDIINMGYLTEYRVFAPPSDLNLSDVPTSASGDFSPKKLAAATKRSTITGDVVKHYLKLARGKLGITFAVDIEDATTIAQAYRAAGVPAEVVTSKTPAALRRSILRRFRARELLQLVNVDLFGEGFDLPAIEVVSMARATQSWILYCQQFGRALRLMDGKLHALIIDHVGNVLRHGLPDKRRELSLGRPVPKAKREPDEDLIPMTVCVDCSGSYERIYRTCPHCGHYAPPAGRTGPRFVDGDLFELTNDVLAKMRGDVEAADAPWAIIPTNPIEAAMRNNHLARQAAQGALRSTIAMWAGHHRAQGRDDSQIHRLFYLTYGTDILSAQAMGRKDAERLQDKLQSRLITLGVALA